MDGGHMNGMTMTPPPSSTDNNNNHTTIHHHSMMHMSFFWSTHGEILFPGWPGSSSGMYALVLIFVFLLAFIVEFLSHTRIGSTSDTSAGVLVQTVIHTLRAGLAYMLMLAVMSFNGGVFLVAVAGHALGFFVFRKRSVPVAGDKNSDQSPMMHA